jgi:lipoate-protein ligase B
VVGRWGIQGERDPRNTGVWVGGRKIAAIGIALRRWVSFHGFAVNNTVDLGWFHRVNPCGMDSNLVTRIADHVDAPPLEAVRDAAADEFRRWWAAWSAPPTEAAPGKETG